MNYDILSIYGNTKLHTCICKRCGDRFFVTSREENTFYCSYCLEEDININQVFKHPKLPEFYIGAKSHKRKPLSQSLRKKIYERDNYRCVYCGIDLEFGISENGKIVIDHFNPFVYGEDESEDNLVTSCQKCNARKHSKMFKDIEEARAYLFDTRKR